MVHGIFLRFLNIATFLYIDSTTMSMWRPLFLKFMILDHKLQRMLNDSKIDQLNSERPLHQTAVIRRGVKNLGNGWSKSIVLENIDVREKTKANGLKTFCKLH